VRDKVEGGGQQESRCRESTVGKGTRPTEKSFWKRRDDSEKEDDGVMELEKERRTDGGG
jgi:hypothetical protein